MSDLLDKKCVPCEGGVTAFDISEIHKYQKKVDGWNVSQNEKNIYFLEKKFIFKNFLESQKFVNEVGKISEEEGHHPDIHFGWGYAKIEIGLGRGKKIHDKREDIKQRDIERKLRNDFKNI